MTWFLIALATSALFAFLEAHPQLTDRLEDALFGKDGDGEQSDARP